MKDSPSPPPAPDYTGAAKATQSSQMVSQNTPYGNLTYRPDPNSPSGFGSDITLAPQAQQALNSQLGLSTEMGNLAQSQIPAVQQQYSHPMDSQSVQDVSNKAYGAMTSRLDPQWQSNQQQFDAKMANQGIPVGSEAYSNANREFQQAKNDAYQQANLGAIQTMPQTYQLESSIYNQPLNTLNAIRSGSQIQNPQFGNAPGANYLSAAQGQGQYGQGLYNAQVGTQNANTAGLYGLGAAGAAAAIPILFSDRRLKTNIKRIGTHDLGIGIYSYEIFGRPSIGVMADEVESVRPEAVVTGEDGFKRVDYGMLNA